MADRFNQARSETRNQEIAEALGLEQDPASGSVYAPTGLPREHLVGASIPDLSQEIVFTVQTGDFPAMTDREIADVAVPHYYWRSVTYDTYNGRGWETTLAESTDYPANELLFETAPPDYRPVSSELTKACGDMQLY
jgi:hypothetical protein